MIELETSIKYLIWQIVRCFWN